MQWDGLSALIAYQTGAISAGLQPWCPTLLFPGAAPKQVDYVPLVTSLSISDLLRVHCWLLLERLAWLPQGLPAACCPHGTLTLSYLPPLHPPLRQIAARNRTRCLDDNCRRALPAGTAAALLLAGRWVGARGGSEDEGKVTLASNGYMVACIACMCAVCLCATIAAEHARLCDGAGSLHHGSHPLARQPTS